MNGQAVIVTGAGRGLGRLYALDLASRGAAVVVNDVGGGLSGDGTDRSVADQVVAEIAVAGGKAVASYDSVETPEGGEAIVRLALEELGRVDAVVSNAGIFRPMAFEEVPASDWRQMLGVHLDGAFHVSQPAYRAMKARGHGRFVFVASSAGLFGQPSLSSYAAAKAGIVGLSNVIAIEGAPHGILSNCVLPFAWTRMASLGRDRDELEPEPGFLHAIEPELVAPLVTFLASRECQITHQNISACAGRFARVFVGLAEGWLAPPDPGLTAEHVMDHLESILATEPYSVPSSIFDEVLEMSSRLACR